MKIIAKNAQIWFSLSKKKLLIVGFGTFQWNEPPGLSSDVGASFAYWREANNVDRLKELLQMAVFFLFEGFDPKTVIREFAKIREFSRSDVQIVPGTDMTHSWIGSCILQAFDLPHGATWEEVQNRVCESHTRHTQAHTFTRIEGA